MTVFIAHDETDRAVAEALEKYLERRGHFVEMEDASRGVGRATRLDTVVALWSKAAAASAHRPLFERRALEAKAEDSLVLVKLDRTPPPDGLRNCASIDAGAKARRETAWAEVSRVAQEAQARGPQDETLPTSAAPPTPAPPKSRPVGGVLLALLAVVVAGGVAFGWLRRDLLVEFDLDRAIAQALKAL